MTCEQFLFQSRLHLPCSSTDHFTFCPFVLYIYISIYRLFSLFLFILLLFFFDSDGGFRIFLVSIISTLQSCFFFWLPMQLYSELVNNADFTLFIVSWRAEFLIHLADISWTWFTFWITVLFLASSSLICSIMSWFH